MSYDASEPSNTVAHGADDSILPDSRIIHRANERLIHEGRPIFVYVGIDIGFLDHFVDMIVIDFADGSYGDGHNHTDDCHDSDDDFDDNGQDFQSGFHKLLPPSNTFLKYPEAILPSYFTNIIYGQI